MNTKSDQLLGQIIPNHKHIPVLLWWILAISSAVRFFFIWYFGDVDFEPDSYAHFLYAVSSFTHLPGSLNFSVGVWQKPFYTLVTGLVIWGTGIKLLWVIKVFNTIIWAIISFLTYLTSRRLQLSEKASLVAVFLVGFSFLGFRSSISVLTEPLFTLMIGAALLALFNKRYTISCVLVSLSVLTRTEGLLLVVGGVLILWLVDRRRNVEPLKSFGDCVYLYNYDLTPVQVPAQLSFGDQAIFLFLKSGWSTIENWGVWALGEQAELSIFVPTAQDLVVEIEAFSQPNPSRQQKVKFMYNNTFVGEYQFPMSNTAPQKISFKIPAKLVTGRLDRIKFPFDYAVSPVEQGINNDARQLAVGFLNMNITPAE